MPSSFQELLDLDINLLQPNPLQVRNLIKSESLVDLVESIKEHGILEPLVVAKTPAGYQLIAGERRWRAAKIVGLKEVPVIVKETDAQGMLEMAIVENVQREDLNPIERAQGLQRLIDEFQLTVTDIAKRVGKSPAYVSNTLRLLTLPDAIKDGLISSDITEGHARAIAGLGDPKLMVDAFKSILSDGSSVRRTEDLVRKIKEEKDIPARNVTKEKIYSAELDKLAANLKKHFDNYRADVKVKQSTVSATIQLTIKGNPEFTTSAIMKIYDEILHTQS